MSILCFCSSEECQVLGCQRVRDIKEKASIKAGLIRQKWHQECGCIGPQNGQPLCLCRMRDQGVTIKAGRYVRPEQDLGPDGGSL